MTDMANDMMNASINLLEAWGRCEVKPTAHLQPKSPIKIIIEREWGSTVPNAKMDDALFSFVDSIVSKLNRKGTQDLHTILKLTYVDRLPTRMAGQQLNMSHQRAANLLGQATSCFHVLLMMMQEDQK